MAVTSAWARSSCPASPSARTRRWAPARWSRDRSRPTPPSSAIPRKPAEKLLPDPHLPTRQVGARLVVLDGKLQLGADRHHPRRLERAPDRVLSLERAVDGAGQR